MNALTENRDIRITYGDFEKQWRREQEVKLRQQDIERKLKLLNTPPLYQGLTLSSFEKYDQRHPAEIKKLEDYIRDFSIIATQPRHGFITGPCGTGKTMAAYIIAESVIKQGFSVRYYRFDDLISEIRSTWSKQNVDSKEFVKSFSKIDLLIIDEFGRHKLSDQDHKDFSDIMDFRYDHKKPNLIISNLFLSDKSPDKPTVFKALGDRLEDRLSQGSPIIMNFNWGSYRKR